jgi:hypothetical protein
VRCEQLEPLIEAIADGSHQPDAAARAHLDTCAVCAARLDTARAIDSLLSLREAAAPSPTFTNTVMARIGQERWKTERVIDLGFNLAIASGVLVIAAGAAGLAWSLGFLSVAIDLDAVWSALGSDVAGRVMSQAQTIGLAAMLLTMALGLWWWAETPTSS